MPVTTTEHAAWRALDEVIDPELDEPITDLGFVRSLTTSDTGDVAVHLRLPTSFCAPNFAYLMASDAKDVLSALSWSTRVDVVLDDHHDSDLINRGLAANTDYRGTFGDEAETSLDELRSTFQRKAHTAAMERALTGMLRADPDLAESALHGVVVADLPEGREKTSLLRRRATLGIRVDPAAPVLVDDDGTPYPPEQVPFRLRFARAVRISIEGNAHFCRGLLRTRYPDTMEQNEQPPTQKETA